MAKAWRNDNAAKINARRLKGSKEATARVQKNERLYLEKIFKVKHSGNWVLAGLLQRLYSLIGIADTTPPYKPVTKHWQYAQMYGASNKHVERVDYSAVTEEAKAKEGHIAKFLRKAKDFFTGK